MTRTNRHGLWGRERRAYQQGRTADICTQEMIEEYVRPNTDRVRSQRPVPIRHKGEFVQTLHSSLNVPLPVDGEQLDLLYRSTTKSSSYSQVSHQTHSKSSRADQSIDGVLLLKPSGSAQHNRFKPAIHNATPQTQKAMKPARYTNTTQQSRKSYSSLTWPGFLYGCVIGGAAAAVTLVVLDATVL